MTTTSTAAKSGSLTPHNLRYLCSAIYDDSGIVLDESKGYLLEARLLPLAKAEGQTGIDDLCNLMRATNGAAVRERVVDAMTTNETLFFRDLRPFDALRDTIFPELIKNVVPARPIRIWSAAASSGQEAYSIAMLWRELGAPPKSVEIFGTDLSAEILDKARAGRYLQIEVNRGLPVTLLVKYFERDGTDWIIKPELRDMVRWRRYNLNDPPTLFGRFDMILCRNVLIYFDEQTKTSILNGFERVLNPDGYLFLGASETTLNLETNFRRQVIDKAVAYRPGSD